MDGRAMGKKMNIESPDEALASASDTLAVGCPFCNIMCPTESPTSRRRAMAVRDVAQISARLDRVHPDRRPVPTETATATPTTIRSPRTPRRRPASCRPGRPHHLRNSRETLQVVDGVGDFAKKLAGNEQSRAVAATFAAWTPLVYLTSLGFPAATAHGRVDVVEKTWAVVSRHAHVGAPWLRLVVAIPDTIDSWARPREPSPLRNDCRPHCIVGRAGDRRVAEAGQR